LAEPDGRKGGQGDEVAEIATEFGSFVNQATGRRRDPVRPQPVSPRASVSAVGAPLRSSRRN
jgi:hypothetical protein